MWIRNYLDEHSAEATIRGVFILPDVFISTIKDINDDMIIGVMTRVIRNGKVITPDNFLYKVYVHLWCDAYPVRIIVLKIRWRIMSFIGKCLSFMKKRILKIKD